MSNSPTCSHPRSANDHSYKYFTTADNATECHNSLHLGEGGSTIPPGIQHLGEGRQACDAGMQFESRQSYEITNVAIKL